MLRIMLPLSHRLPTQDVSRVMRHGKRVHGKMMTIVTRLRSDEVTKLKNLETSKPRSLETGAPRFAFVTGVKVSKKAVERNRVKRLLRESVHHLLPSLASGYDVVIVAKRELVGKTQNEVEMNLREALLKERMFLE